MREGETQGEGGGEGAPVAVVTGIASSRHGWRRVVADSSMGVRVRAEVTGGREHEDTIVVARREGGRSAVIAASSSLHLPMREGARGTSVTKSHGTSSRHGSSVRERICAWDDHDDERHDMWSSLCRPMCEGA